MEEKKYSLQINKTQAYLLMQALDFYSRIGIGQFEEVCSHPTFQKGVEEMLVPQRPPRVGDHTPQGEILEIEGRKALIAGSVKEGVWNKEPEWKALKDVRLSTDWSLYHLTMNAAKEHLYQAKAVLTGYSPNASYGIHHPTVDESCRIAFDMQQVIRNFFYKERGDTSWTVDSSIHKTGTEPLIQMHGK